MNNPRINIAHQKYSCAKSSRKRVMVGIIFVAESAQKAVPLSLRVDIRMSSLRSRHLIPEGTFQIERSIRGKAG